MYFLVKDDRKLILITPRHGNTPCFLIFPFFETFRGRSPLCRPVTPPLHTHTNADVKMHRCTL